MMKEKEKTALIKERFDVAVGGLAQGITVITDKDGKPLLSERVDDDPKGISPF